MSDAAGAKLSVAVEHALASGELGRLSPEDRAAYYQAVCNSLGLNALTQPLAYIMLGGKLRLYALRDATDQLRRLHSISITICAREVVDGDYVVTARAIDKHGRADESIGSVAMDSLKGEARANARMKAETKAKRRVTLSICGLGMLDETETETIPGARTVDAVASAVNARSHTRPLEAEEQQRIREDEIWEERINAKALTLEGLQAMVVPELWPLLLHRYANDKVAAENDPLWRQVQARKAALSRGRSAA